MVATSLVVVCLDARTRALDHTAAALADLRLCKQPAFVLFNFRAAFLSVAHALTFLMLADP